MSEEKIGTVEENPGGPQLTGQGYNVPMPQTAEEMRALTDRFMATRERFEAERWWSVMTALRGPDLKGFRTNDLKYRTTCPIRRTAFPETVAVWPNYNVMGSISAEYDRPHFYEEELVGKWQHFSNHVVNAWRVLSGKHDNYVVDSGIVPQKKGGQR